MCGVSKPRHVLSELDDGMLEPAAGSEKRKVGFARKLDCSQDSTLVPVRAAWGHPHSVEWPQLLPHVMQGICVDPFGLDGDKVMTRRELERRGNGAVSNDVRVFVTNQCNAQFYGLGHNVSG